MKIIRSVACVRLKHLFGIESFFNVEGKERVVQVQAERRRHVESASVRSAMRLGLTRAFVHEQGHVFAVDKEFYHEGVAIGREIVFLFL